MGWPSMVCVPAVTMCGSGPGRPALRWSSMKPAMTDRAAFPVQSTNSSVMSVTWGEGGRHGPGETRGNVLTGRR